MTKPLAKRISFYQKLYSNKIASVSSLTKDGVKYLQAFREDGQKLGRPVKENAEAHRLLSKEFPKFFSPPSGYTFVEGNKRLVQSKNANITTNFKAADFKKYGFNTGREGQQFVKNLKQKGVYVKNENDLQIYTKVGRIAHNILSHNYFKKQDDRANKIIKLFKKNIGRVYVQNMPSAYKDFQQTSTVKYVGRREDIVKYFQDITPFLYDKILIFLRQEKACKFQFSLQVKFAKEITRYEADKIEKKLEGKKTELKHIQEGDKMKTIATFFSPVLKILNEHEILDKIDDIISNLIEKVSKFSREGSGWFLEKIEQGFINLVRYQLTTGSSWFELSKFITTKKAVVNIKNQDNRCFLYSIITALHYNELDTKKLDRLNQFKKFFDMYPFDDSDMPMCTDLSKKIRKYEDIVKRNINILYYENGTTEIRPYHASDNNHEESICLMLCHDSNQNKNHFVTVRNISRLLSQEVSKDHSNKFFCMRCLSHFSNQPTLDKHYEICSKNEVCKIVMPADDKSDLHFTSIHKMLKVPFVVYGDFESLILPDETEKGDKSIRTSKHTSCGAKYIIVSSITNSVIKKFLYRGENCVRIFLESLMKDCHELYNEYFKDHKKIDMTPKDWETYNNSTTCHICNKGDFATKEENDQHWKEKKQPHPNGRVKDHCHLTGKFRGLAHSACNIQLQLKSIFPVIFHNLKGYDSHFIIKEIRQGDCDEIQVIPVNREKFISFSLKFKEEERKYKNYEIRFIDSLSFMNSSLEKLAENLEIQDFKYVTNFVEEYCKWENDPEEKNRLFNLIKQKGVYPYEYMDSWQRFEETDLPGRRKFISKLSHETKFYHSLSDKQRAELEKDYLHAKLVWKKFQCKNLGDYHDLYLQSDVYLLADVFEKFRQISLEKFKLDPTHYFTLPGMSWDAMLKHTRVHLHLFTEAEKEMYLMMESRKIGGISGTGGKRHARANNKYLHDYNPNMKSNYIVYGDANGLYSWAMSQKLPIDSFRWINPDEFSLEKALMMVDSDFGYFVEGDFSIPDELHDEQNDYPCFPENLCVGDDMLSPYQKEVRNKIEKLTLGREKEEHNDSKIAKLIPNLLPKKKYIIHIKTLKLFLDLGCKVDKIHRVLEFRQEAWMKPYIDLCMNERAKKGISEFEKDFWKLCCNAVYGKTLENVRNRVDVKLVADEKKAQKLVNKPTLKNNPVQINESGLLMIDMTKPTIKLDKPVYAGIAVLNLSKFLMYDFWYNTIKKKYSDAVMLYTDTDSFIFEIFTDDFYGGLIRDKKFLDKWDLSNYSPNHPMFAGMNRGEVEALINKNKKKVGFFKDETEGQPIQEYVGIRAKCYSLLLHDESKKNTCKGVKRAVLKRLNHKKYYDCVHHNYLPQNLIHQEKMSYIRSNNHSVYGEEITKTCLCPFDDKKYILDDGITQLSYGHYKLKNNLL